MNSVSVDIGTVEVRVENVGGIDETSATIPPGVTVLVGRNATNRTSFLKAVMAALGSEAVPLKAGRTDGFVECVIDDESYHRTATRENGTVVTGGSPYLESTPEAESFAFLLESNDARRAVERGDDLREVVLEPLDVGRLRQEIRDLERRRTSIDERLAERESLEERSRALTAERDRISDDLATARNRYSSLRSTIEEADEATLTDRYQTTAERRTELEEVHYDQATVRESLSALREERQSKRSVLDDLEPVPDPDELAASIEDKRRERQRLDSRLSELQRVVQFNQRRLESEDGMTERAVDVESAPTNQLVEDRTTCWTCGETVDTEQIHSTVEQLRAYRQELLDRRETIDESLNELRDQLDELEETRDRADDLRERLDEIESAIARREERLQSLERRESELELQIDDVLEPDDPPERDDAILEAHSEASRLEATIDHLEEERESVEEELETVEADLDEMDELEDRRDDLADELANRRDEVDALERRAIEEFNEKMEEILEELEYDNVERIWLERRVHTETDEIVPDATFDLHVVRSADDGTVYEDTVDHLSESEREITGLVFALAGFLAHDVYESMPFLVLDSLEAIDGERIASLIDYVSQYASYLLVALLPDDAQYVEADHRITDI